MPVLRINATSRGLTLNDTADLGQQSLQSATDAKGPLVIMVHGYKYAPCQSAHSPHTKIFSSNPNAWPAQLGFNSGKNDEGTAIAFGWYARGPLHRAYKRATDLGETLAVLIAMAKAQAPARPVHIIAHSLGVQAALSALPHLPAGSVGRMVLLTGASFASHARNMVSTPAGRAAEVFNITSRENDFFDLAFENLVPRPEKLDHAIGQGIDAPNVRTLQLDCAQTLEAFKTLGFPVSPCEKRVCHWSSYKRKGVMALYAQMLRAPEKLPLAAFDTCLPPAQTPRWSRLMGESGSWRGLGMPVILPALPLALRAGKRIMPKSSLQGKTHEHAY